MKDESKHIFCPEGETHRVTHAMGNDPSPTESHDPIPFDVACNLIADFESLSDEQKLQS